MLTLKISDILTVTLYDSIKEFPVSLHLEAKQYAIMQSALATTPEELMQRKERMDLLLAFDQIQDYNTEAYNYQLAEQLMADENYNIQELEWGCHLQAINGRSLVDHSEETLLGELTFLKIKGLMPSHIADSLRQIQEKMEVETKRYYPARYPKGAVFNNLARLVGYGLALAEHIEVDTEASRLRLDQTILELLRMQKPLNLKDAPDNVLVGLEKSQFKLYTTLQECGCNEPEKLTVFQFYNWIEVLEERNAKHQSPLSPRAKI